MVFTSYEELKASVASRRDAVLTLEVDLGGSYSQEYEDAKKELAQAKALRQVAGGTGFLGESNLEPLEERVALLRPSPNSVYVQYRQLALEDWAKLVKSGNKTPLEQYESVLPQTFIGLYGQDPTEEDDEGNLIYPDLEPLTTSGAAVSSKGNEGILAGPLLHQVVQSFMAWQNSSGEVSIRPTKSGRV
jgi:hypothetical protein